MKSKILMHTINPEEAVATQHFIEESLELPKEVTCDKCKHNQSCTYAFLTTNTNDFCLFDTATVH